METKPSGSEHDYIQEEPRELTDRDINLIGFHFDPCADPAEMVALADAVQADIDRYTAGPEF